MDRQTEDILRDLYEITEFTKQHAFNDTDQLTPAGYIADQFLRRSTQLAEDFALLVHAGHELNAAILLRVISERLNILAYLHEHDQFKAFQDYSMAWEYQTLQHMTSDEQTTGYARQAAEERKAEIRRSMRGEPSKPADYWTTPSNREALKSVSEGHPNSNLAHIINYEIPSSAVHPRHNDAEPTRLSTQTVIDRATAEVTALTLLALKIEGNGAALQKLVRLTERLFPE